MRRLIGPAFVTLLLTACSGVLTLQDVEVDALGAHTSGSSTFRAHLSVAEEIPEPSDIARNPQGQATFQLSHDGGELAYKLIVANIENVRMAHIHLAPIGETGPVVAWLYPAGPPPQEIPGFFNGVLAEGVITAAELVGPLAGAELADLIDEIRAGSAYVNVHTAQNPPGEIRGQIR
jgi:hypothetical protein